MIDWKKFAQFAADIYDDENVKTNTAQDLEYSITHIESVSVVTFRGTDEWRDWITNLDQKQIEIEPGVYAHRGFWESTIDVFDRMYEEVKDAKTIFCTGHSLGGARAKCFAFKAGADHSRVFGITLGDPRCGDEAFGKVFRSRVNSWRRYRHMWDPVAAVPSTALNYADEMKPIRLFSLSRPSKWHSVAEYVKRIS